MANGAPYNSRISAIYISAEGSAGNSSNVFETQLVFSFRIDGTPFPAISTFVHPLLSLEPPGDLKERVSTMLSIVDPEFRLQRVPFFWCEWVVHDNYYRTSGPLNGATDDVAERISSVARDTIRSEFETGIRQRNIEMRVNVNVDKGNTTFGLTFQDSLAEWLNRRSQRRLRMPLELEIVGFGEGSEEAVLCTVCLQEAPAGTEVARLPCSHLFHEECVMLWLHSNHTCPMCGFNYISYIM